MKVCLLNKPKIGCHSLSTIGCYEFGFEESWEYEFRKFLPMKK